MKSNNERPETVPKEAIFNASQNHWELGIKAKQEFIGRELFRRRIVRVFRSLRIYELRKVKQSSF